jgi:hypothetical protein
MRAARLLAGKTAIYGIQAVYCIHWLKTEFLPHGRATMFDREAS